MNWLLNYPNPTSEEEVMVNQSLPKKWTAAAAIAQQWTCQLQQDTTALFEVLLRHGCIHASEILLGICRNWRIKDQIDGLHFAQQNLNNHLNHR